MEIPQVIIDNPDGLEWYLNEPEHIQEMICEYPPGFYLYHDLKARLYSYNDDGTVGCLIIGIDPDILIPITEEEINSETNGQRLL